MDKKLIINADGFGFTEGINRGIIESIEKGVVSSISCNVNFPYIKDVGYIMKYYPNISIGLHFNINVGKPVCQPELVPSLVNINGEFWSDKFTKRLLSKKIKISELQRECEAQILKLQSYGVEISHLDGHQNKHLYPQYFRSFLKLGNKYGIKRIRCHRRYIFLKVNHKRKIKILQYYFAHPKQILTHSYDRIMMNLANSKGFIMADRMISHGYVKEYEKYDLDSWIQIIRALPKGVNEIYCHPGYPDDELRKYAKYVDERRLELSVLTSPELIQTIQKENIKIISFTQL